MREPRELIVVRPKLGHPNENVHKAYAERTPKPAEEDDDDAVSD